MPVIFWDIETRSTLALETVGAWRYATATTEVLCIGFAVDEAEPEIWTPGQPIPPAFVAAAADPSWLIVAHNYAFERAIEMRILTPRYGWPHIPIAQQRCSMTLALANALPGGLDAAAAALGLAIQKDAEGYRSPARVRSGKRYAKSNAKRAPEDTTQIAPLQPQIGFSEAAKIPSEANERTGEPPIGSSSEHNLADAENDDADAGDDEIEVSLADLIDEELVNGMLSCPFHADSVPSMKIYHDHYYCFGCGAHGSRIDWLMAVEGHSRAEAAHLIANWDGPITPRQSLVSDDIIKRASALRLWEEARPIAGTLAARYLADIRGVVLGVLPTTTIDDVLRFHPRCPFGPGQHPCLIALMRNVVTDAPTGIHRIALTPDARKIERRTLGNRGVVKLWPAGTQLVVGEGLETVLAAASRISYDDKPLQPAWAVLSADMLGGFSVLNGVERLIILVDHDEAGLTAAATCEERWIRAGRTVVQLTPERPGDDFNDIVMQELAL
jgi:hypothetical protein